jgi:hypothetical protein
MHLLKSGNSEGRCLSNEPNLFQKASVSKPISLLMLIGENYVR